MIATEPPQSAPLAALDRRTLFKAGAFGIGLVGLQGTLHAASRGFSHGVASGEPGVDKVLLWTRFVGDQSTALEFQLSETLDFATPVSGGSAPTSFSRAAACSGFGLCPRLSVSAAMSSDCTHQTLSVLVAGWSSWPSA